jgi:hypothetical protein
MNDRLSRFNVGFGARNGASMADAPNASACNSNVCRMMLLEVDPPPDAASVMMAALPGRNT